MKRTRLLLPLAILAVLTCQDDRRLFGPSVPQPFLQINDGHSGDPLNEHFVFLFPIRSLAEQPPEDEAFDPTLQPVVKICKWNGSACGSPAFELTMSSGTVSTVDGVSVRLNGIVVYPDLEKYVAAWDTRTLGLRRDEIYRIRVLVEGRELGFVDAKVVETIRQLQAVDRSQYVPLLRNSILPIPFWIGEGALFVIGPTGGTITAFDGAVSFTVSANTLADNTEITIAPLTGEPAGGGVLVVSGTAYDFGPDGLTFDPPAQLTITYDEAQLPPGTAEQTLTLLHIVNGSAQVVPGSTVNAGANTVTGPIARFSSYAVGNVGPIRLGPPVTVGSGLQKQAGGSLPGASQNNVTVTLQGGALLAPDAMTPPQPLITVTVPSGQTGFSYYVQADEGTTGPVGIVASAPGYDLGTTTADVVPAAFQIVGLAANLITTSPEDEFEVQVGVLNNNTGLFEPQAVRSGAPTPLPVSLATSDPNVGAFVTAATPSPGSPTVLVEIQPTMDRSTHPVAFHPLAIGAVTITASSSALPGSVDGTQQVSVSATVTRVRVGPETADIHVGESLQLNALLLDASHQPVTLPVTWSTQSTSISVDQMGRVTGLALGTGVVDATAEGVTGSATIHVIDDVAPVLTAPANIAVGATSSAGAVVTYAAPSAVDDLDPNPVVACTPASGSLFPIGATTVSCTATDASGNSTTATFTVTVVDDDPPSLTAPSALTVGTNSACSYTGPIGTATASDDISSGAALTITNDAPLSFPLGATTVTWTATDATGNSTSATQVVTVVDDDAPTISAPANLTVGTNSGASYVGAIGSATASDNCSSGAALAITHNAPASFPVGTTTVTWTATDAAGNSATATQMVTVVDDDPPSLMAPAALTVGTNTGCSYTGPIGTATASDDISSGAGLIITNDAPALFPLGTTTVTWTATDAAGNSTSATQQVTVGDDDAPAISAPGALTVGTNSGASYVGAIGSASASDNCSSGAALAITNNAPASFPVGTTVVTWTATDAAGNSATATQMVTVVDDDPPSLTAPSALTVGTNSACSYTGPIGTATASDDISSGAALTITNDAPLSFPLGATTVTWTATDAAGNSTSATQVITVVDDDAPLISAPGDLTVGTNSGASYVGAIGSATASDNCSSGAALTITHNAPASFPVGTTTVTWTATDAAGNSATATQMVTVVDDDPPSLTVPANLTVTATSSAGAVVTYSVSASDAVDPSPVVGCTPSSGATFPLGTSAVSCTATDAAGNLATATFQVTVAPNAAPTATISSPASGTSVTFGQVVTFNGSGADPEDGALSSAALVWTSSLDGEIGTGTSFTTSSLSPGNHIITLTATDVLGATGTATIELTVGSLGSITLATTLNVSLGGTASLPIFLSSPAAAGGVTVSVTSSDPQKVKLLTPSVSFAQGQSAANALVSGEAPGTVTVEATAPGYAKGQSQVRTLANLNILQSSPLTFAQTFPPTIDIRLESGGVGAAAPGGGLSVTLAAANSGCVAVPSPLTIPQGQVVVQAQLTYGGSAPLPCTTTVTASATNVDPDAIQVTVQPTPSITAGAAHTVGGGLQRSNQGFLGTSSHGGVTVTIASSNPQVLLVSPDANTPGQGSITINLLNGQNTFVYQMQGLASAGTATVTASAPGFSSGTVTIGLAQAMYDVAGLPASTTTLSPDVAFVVRMGIGSQAGLNEVQAVRAGATTLTATVTNSNAAVAQLVTSPLPGQIATGQSATVQIESGRSSSPSSIAQGGVAFDGIGPGATTVTASIPGLVATGNAARQVNVTAPSITAGAAHTVGGGLQRSNQGFLGASDHGGVTVRIESTDPQKLLVAKDANTPGSAFIDISLLDGQNTFVYHMQGLASAGTASVKASAPGFTDGTVAITLVQPALDIAGLPSTTATLSPDVAFVARVGIANASQTILQETQAVRAGGSALTATVSNSNATVAQLKTSVVTGQSVTVEIPPSQASSPSGVAQGGVAFRALNAGSTTVTSSIPGILALPTASRQVTVSAPPITAGAAHTVGGGLQRSNQGFLGASNHGGVTVTITSSDPQKLLVSPNATTAGQASITIPLADGQTTFLYHMQGLATAGTVTVTASAPGFTDGTIPITLAPPALDIAGLPSTTTTLSPDVAFVVRVGIANASQTILQETQAVRAGGSALTATVSNSDATVAQLKTSVVTGQSVTVEIPPSQASSPSSVVQGGVSFDAIGAGTTTVVATIPGHLALPTASRQVTVSAPPITAGAAHTVGGGLQRSNQGFLGASNHGGVTVTITSSDPQKLLVSPNATTAGQASITIPLADGQSTFLYHMQGLATAGTVTITASAPGFTDGTIPITLAAPALDIAGLPSTTTTLSPDVAFVVRVGIANASQTILQETQAVRAGGSALTATVSNSDATVAQLKTSVVTGQSVTVEIPPSQASSPSSVAQGGVSFEPMGPGSTTVAASIPGILATTASSRLVTVSMPSIAAGSQLTVGGGLQRSNQGFLGASDHGGTTVTLTSSNSQKLLIAPNASTPGSPSITITIASGQTTFLYHMQALANTGTESITASAPGFSNGSVFVILAEPALEITSLPTSTTATSTNTPFAVRVGIANSFNTALAETQAVRAGGSTLTANLSNSAAMVAQLVTSASAGQTAAVAIQPTQSQSPTTVAAGGVAFDPLSGGTTTVAATIPGVVATTAASRQVTVTP